MKTVNLAQELDSKVLASCPTAAVENCPIERPLAPGFVSAPAQPSAHNGTQPSPIDSVPDPSTTDPEVDTNDCDLPPPPSAHLVTFWREKKGSSLQTHRHNLSNNYIKIEHWDDGNVLLA